MSGTATRTIFATPGGNTRVVPGFTTPPFPAKYPDPLRPNTKLQRALDAAIARGPGAIFAAPVGIAYLGDTAGSHASAFFRADEVHYAASLVKVAAMYAAYELRRTLRAMALEIGSSATPSTFLAKAAGYLDPRILAEAQTFKQFRGISPVHALPKYSQAFQCTAAGGGVGVDFTGAFKNTHLLHMIDVSNNGDAAACVHGSGYGYLNGALRAAGFFDNTSGGLWLAGDYAQQYPYYRFPSVNDGPSSHAASVRSLTALFALLFDKTLVDAASSTEMLDLLTQSVAQGEVFINRSPDFSDFTVTHCKLGLGPLKSGPLVLSETAIVKHSSGAQFVAAWINFKDGLSLDVIADVVRDTVKAFLGP